MQSVMQVHTYVSMLYILIEVAMLITQLCLCLPPLS